MFLAAAYFNFQTLFFKLQYDGCVPAANTPNVSFCVVLNTLVLCFD